MRADNLAISITDEDWDTVLDTNLTAAFRLTRGVLRGMIRARFGRVISIASIVGPRANAGQANYAASKAGLIAMSKTVAVEVARRGVTVNTVAPGFIETDMTTDVPDAVIAAVPARRAGTSGRGRRVRALPGIGGGELCDRQHRLCRRGPRGMTNQQKGADVSAAVTAEQVEQVVRTSLESFGAEPDAINRDAKLEDLDIDSLDLAELSQIVEEQYGVNLTSSDVKAIVTVGDAVDIIVERA